MEKYQYREVDGIIYLLPSIHKPRRMRFAMSSKKTNRLTSDSQMLQKAAIYVRVSTHWQIDKDSLPLQREELLNYCKYALGMERSDIFEDAGYSAKNTERPAYQQMMARLRTGEFSHLVVWKIDRISRNLIDFATMYEEIKRLGIAFVSKNEQFDTSSAMGEAMLKIILVFAELERKVTSERVTATMLSRAASGQWNGGRVPFGYHYDKTTKTFSIIESEAAVVRMIFNLYEQERSLVVVAKMLNEKSIKSRRGSSWSPTTVQTILRSPFYIGIYRYNYRDESRTGNVSYNDIKPESEWILIENNHVGVIERGQWERVSEFLTSNRRIKGTGTSYNRGNVHVFAGLLRCGYCGSVMGATTDRERSNGWKPSIYLCSRKRRFNDCKNKYVSDVKIGPPVINFIANLVKVHKSFGRTTDIAVLEKKLLRGKELSEVEHIEGVGLQELYDTLRREKFPDIFTYETQERPEPEKNSQEIDLLASEKRRLERALSRLQNLFLYSEDAIPEKDYVLERKRMTDELEKVDTRINELEESRASQFSVSDYDFLDSASHFIINQSLGDIRDINYEKYIREIDPRIFKDFLRSNVQNFCIKDSKVELIRFKNGIELRLLHKDEE